MSGWVAQLNDAMATIQRALLGLLEPAVGDTAVGTGLNADPHFSETVARKVGDETGEKFVSTPNKFAALSAHDAMVNASGEIKAGERTDAAGGAQRRREPNPLAMWRMPQYRVKLGLSVTTGTPRSGPTFAMCSIAMPSAGIAKLIDAGTCEGSVEATAQCHLDWRTQVSCRQIRNAFDRARR